MNAARESIDYLVSEIRKLEAKSAELLANTYRSLSP